MKRISHYIKLVLLFFFTSMLTSFSMAQKGGGGGRFTAGALLGVGQGQMGNGVGVPNRAMFFTNVGLFAGYNIKKFRIGGNYEYNLAGQSDDPASVSGQNLSGKGSAVGLRLDYYDGKQSLGLIYRLSDTYNLDQPTAAGTSATYKSKGGFQIQYYRQFKKRFGFVIDYTTETFDDSLTDPVKFNRISLGVVFTNFANSK